MISLLRLYRRINQVSENAFFNVVSSNMTHPKAHISTLFVNLPGSSGALEHGSYPFLWNNEWYGLFWMLPSAETPKSVSFHKFVRSGI